MVWKKQDSQIIDHEALTGLYVMFSMVGPRSSAFKNTSRQLRTVTIAPLHQFTAVVDATQYSTNTNINIPHPVNIPPFIADVFCKYKDQRKEILIGEMGAW